MKKKHSTRPQDRPQTKIRIASRRARLLQLFTDGKSTRQASAILKKEGFHGASKSRVAQDLAAMQTDFADKVVTERHTAYEELKALKQIIASADDMSTGEGIDKWLAVHDRLSRLLGLDAPTKNISAKVDVDVDPDKLVGYRRFVRETCHMGAEQLEKLWTLCRELNIPPAPVQILPPDTSELWDEDLAPKQLTEAGCDS